MRGKKSEKEGWKREIREVPADRESLAERARKTVHHGVLRLSNSLFCLLYTSENL